MNKNEINALIKEAIKIAKQGDLPRAREMITEIVDGDPENEQALLAYAFIAPNKLEAEQVLEEVLRINPNNVTALKQIAKLRESDPEPSPFVEPAPTASPFTETPAFTSDYQEPVQTAFETADPIEAVPAQGSTTEGPSYFAAPEKRRVPCIQCGKPAEGESNYCEACQAEIDNKKQALPTYGGINTMELERKITELIAVQKEQQEELRKISRAANLYFWLTIIGFGLSIIYLCFMIFGFTSLISGGGFDIPLQ